MIPTTLVPFLSVRNGAKAVEFYKAAFAAEELFRFEDPTSGVVSQPRHQRLRLLGRR